MLHCCLGSWAWGRAALKCDQGSWPGSARCGVAGVVGRESKHWVERVLAESVLRAGLDDVGAQTLGCYSMCLPSWRAVLRCMRGEEGITCIWLWAPFREAPVGPGSVWGMGLCGPKPSTAIHVQSAAAH